MLNHVLVYKGGGGMAEDEAARRQISLQQATDAARDCPILTAGGSVEVYETFQVM